jgi:GxxExxY protein
MQEINEQSHLVIGAAIEVHRHLGPGLLESSYEAAFSHELSQRNIPHSRQVSMPVRYKGHELDAGYRIDVLAFGKIVVELKSVDKLQPIHAAQVLSYLRLGSFPLGLLINFNSRRLVDGIERIANHVPNL